MKANQEPSPREHLARAVVFMRRGWRAGRWGALAFAIGLAVTTVVILAAKRLYRSESVIMYDRGVRREAVVGAASDADSPKQIATRLQDMMTSRQRLQKMIEAFSLYPGIVKEHTYVEAVDEMQKHLKFTAREGFTFHLSFEYDSRETAQKVLAAFVDSLIEDDMIARKREAESTKTFLDAEKKQADQDLKTREAALSVFLVQHPELAAESTSVANATAGAYVRSIDREKVTANPGELASLEMQASQIEDMLAVASAARPAAAAGASPAEQAAALSRSQAEAMVSAARRDLADKRATFTDEHPDVKAAQRRVAEAESDLRRANAASTARSTPAAEAAAAEEDPAGSSRVASLRRALAAVRGQIASLHSRTAPRPIVPKLTAKAGGAEQGGAVAIEWTRLFRDVSEARERQNQLESRVFQTNLYATLASSGGAGRLIVVDPAFKPTRPVAGQRTKTLLLGAGASLMLALLVMMALAFLDDGLYSASDVQRVIGDQFVVMVPALPVNERKRLPPMSGEGG
jgi:uncharacterized protein involved in exopolysaccharide biosynthesis